MSKALILLVAITLTVLLSLVVIEVVSANPVVSPLIMVNSPKNNAIYPSNTVALDFSALPDAWFNFTSFTYVLDNQPPKATNGTSILADLPAGSHTLTIYGRGTAQSGGTYYENQDMLVDRVYFSTEYSSAWLTFTIIALATVTIVPSLLFLRRRQIATRLSGKKTDVFWLGITLLVLSIIAFIPAAWKQTADYLYPRWPPSFPTGYLPYPLMFIGGLIFMGVGVGMMWLGTKDKSLLIKDVS